MLLAVFVPVIVVVVVLMYFLNVPPTRPIGPEAGPPITQAVFDPSNAIYIVDGEKVVLADGSTTQEAAPGSAEKITTKLFGTPTVGNIGGGDKNDAAVILVRTGAGSGTFYYVAAAMYDYALGNRASGTNAVFLGDRIAPDTMQIANGVITVNYADRAAGEPMTTAPSIGISKYLVVAGGTLYDVPIAVIYPLASGIAWGDMKMATVSSGDANVPGTLAGIKIVSQPIANITDLSAVSLPFENYYKKKLTAAGWTVDNALAAGGPGAAVIGYRKGNEYVILQYASVFKNNGGGIAPETCPCDMTFSIFVGILK